MKQHEVRSVAVVGGSRYLGAHLVGALLREPTIDKVVAIDAVKPSAQFRRRMNGAEIVRIDMQSPRLQGILREHGIDTVVHAGLHHNDFTPGGRAAIKESNIMGSMHVIAAAGRAAGVKRFVLLSSASVYGSSGVDPALFSEEMAARRSPGGGIPRDYLSVEGYVRGMSRKRPDVAVTILRMPAILGLPEPTVFGELLQPTITPVLAGYDPRIQLLHPSDALEALVLAATRGPAGTFNIAADGIVTLSQAVRRAGHIAVPVAAPFFRVAAGVLTGEGLKNIGPSQMQYLRYGRCIDNRRMREVFGFEPRYTTNEALEAYFRDYGMHPLVSAEFVRKSFDAALAATLPQWRPAMAWAFDRVYAQIDRPAEQALSVRERQQRAGRLKRRPQLEPRQSSASGTAVSTDHVGRKAPASVAARTTGSTSAVAATESATRGAKNAHAPEMRGLEEKRAARQEAREEAEQRRQERREAAAKRAADKRAEKESAEKAALAAPAKDTVTEPAPADKAPAKKAPAKKAPAKKTTAATTETAKAPAQKAPAKKAPTKKAPAKKAPAKKAAAKSAKPAAKPAAKAPAKSAAKPAAAASKPAAKKSTKSAKPASTPAAKPAASPSKAARSATPTPATAAKQAAKVKAATSSKPVAQQRSAGTGKES